VDRLDLLSFSAEATDSPQVLQSNLARACPVLSSERFNRAGNSQRDSRHRKKNSTTGRSANICLNQGIREPESSVNRTWTFLMLLSLTGFCQESLADRRNVWPGRSVRWRVPVSLSFGPITQFGGWRAGPRFSLLTTGTRWGAPLHFQGPGFADPRYRIRWSSRFLGPYSWTSLMPHNFDAEGNESFAKQWAKRNSDEVRGANRLAESLVLREGMSQDEVMNQIGSPSSRLVRGSQEVWRYSGYSLAFEQARLKELR